MNVRKRIKDGLRSASEHMEATEREAERQIELYRQERDCPSRLKIVFTILIAAAIVLGLVWVIAFKPFANHQAKQSLVPVGPSCVEVSGSNQPPEPCDTANDQKSPVHNGPGSWPTPPMKPPLDMSERVFMAINNDPLWAEVFDAVHMVSPADMRVSQVVDGAHGFSIVVRDGVKLVYVSPVGMRVFSDSLVLEAPSLCLVPVGKYFAEIGTYAENGNEYTAVEYIGDHQDPAELTLDEEPKAPDYCPVGTAISADSMNIVLPPR